MRKGDGAPPRCKRRGFRACIHYDIRFDVTLPGGEECGLVVDVEAQGDAKKSYDIETRGIVYCGRMISDQLGHALVRDSHYEKIRKVYTIWVCMESAQKNANTISEYGISEVGHVGSFKGSPKIDLMNVILIRLPKDKERDKAKNPPTRIMELLSVLLSGLIPPEEKIRMLEDRFGIACTEVFVKEVMNMCNYSEIVAERASAETSVDNIRSLMRHLNLTEEEAMDALGFTGEKREQYARMLEEEATER